MASEADKMGLVSERGGGSGKRRHAGQARGGRYAEAFDRKDRADLATQRELVAGLPLRLPLPRVVRPEACSRADR